MIFLLNSLESFLWVTLLLDSVLSLVISVCVFCLCYFSLVLLMVVVVGESPAPTPISGNNVYRCSHYCHPICLGLAVDLRLSIYFVANVKGYKSLSFDTFRFHMRLLLLLLVNTTGAAIEWRKTISNELQRMNSNQRRSRCVCMAVNPNKIYGFSYSLFKFQCFHHVLPQHTRTIEHRLCHSCSSRLVFDMYVRVCAFLSLGNWLSCCALKLRDWLFFPTSIHSYYFYVAAQQWIYEKLQRNPSCMQ